MLYKFHIAGGITNRWEVAKTVWPYMISMCLAYFFTLCLFPGIESEVPSCRLLSWMPVILIGIFNLFDFIGKVRQINKTVNTFLLNMRVQFITAERNEYDFICYKILVP